MFTDINQYDKEMLEKKRKQIKELAVMLDARYNFFHIIRPFGNLVANEQKRKQDEF